MKFKFSKVVGLQLAILLGNGFPHRHFSSILLRFSVTSLSLDYKNIFINRVQLFTWDY